MPLLSKGHALHLCYPSKAYLARIDQVNEVVKAVSAVNTDAVQIGKKLDSERALGTLRGRLHGTPILVKDVFLIIDGTDTTGKTGLPKRVCMHN
jgi:amidase